MNQRINMNRALTLVFTLFLALTSYSQAWIELGTGGNAINANNTIWSVIADPAGNIYAAGGFTDSPSYISGYSYVARWSGTAWSPLGTGGNALNANNAIYALSKDAAGNIYAAGNFTDHNGRQYVAQWNGSTWAELGVDSIGLNATAPIYAVVTDLSGNVYAAGDFNDLIFAYGHRYVAKWNGSIWSEVGLDSIYGLNADSTIYALATDRHGYLYAAGAFTDSLGYYYVARWNDTVWAPLGTDSTALHANGQINALITDTAGNVYAAGTFQDTSGYYYIAKWNGSTWTELSDPATNQVSLIGPINALALDSVGNVYAGGMIPDSDGNFFIVVVWNGSRLLVANNSGSDPLNANAPVMAMCADRSGNIYAAGNFTDQNDFSYVAEFTGNIPSGISPVTIDYLHIYPNPTSGLISIDADHLVGTTTITLLDDLGRSLYTQSTVSSSIQARLDLSRYTSGVYTLMITDASGTIAARRIVKQ